MSVAYLSLSPLRIGTSHFIIDLFCVHVCNKGWRCLCLLAVLGFRFSFSFLHLENPKTQKHILRVQRPVVSFVFPAAGMVKGQKRVHHQFTRSPVLLPSCDILFRVQVGSSFRYR